MKKYVFNNYHTKDTKKRIYVEAKTILEAKRKVKEMGHENMRFETIRIPELKWR